MNRENVSYEEMLKQLPDMIAEATAPFRFGQKIYVLECRAASKYATTNIKILKEKCPVCGDTGHITYKGYDLTCSYCKDTSRKSVNCIELAKYTVREYIINNIRMHLSGEEKKSDYSSERFVMPRISGRMQAFCKYGRSHENVMYIDVVPKDVRSEPVRESEEDMLRIMTKRSLVFDNREAAAETLENIRRCQKSELKEFNKKYGTNHEYPFS